MIILGILIFSFCGWAIFSKHFCDGIITKHFLSFSAITAMLVILDPQNGDAALASVLLLICGMAYWFFKQYRIILSHINHFHH